MTKHIEIEVTVRPTTTEEGDTAGYVLTQGVTPVAIGRLFQVAPGAAIKLTLPDPAPIDTKGLDVKGFLSAGAPGADGQAEDDVEGHLWMMLPIAIGGYLLGYGGVSFYRDNIETHEVPRNPKGGNYNP